MVNSHTPVLILAELRTPNMSHSPRTELKRLLLSLDQLIKMWNYSKTTSSACNYRIRLVNHFSMSVVATVWDSMRVQGGAVTYDAVGSWTNGEES